MLLLKTCDQVLKEMKYNSYITGTGITTIYIGLYFFFIRSKGLINMGACQADSLASEISPSYYFPNKSYHTFIWTCGLAWLVRSHLNEI